MPNCGRRALAPCRRAWQGGGKRERLRAANGSYLDTRGGGTGNLTDVIVHPRKNVDNQFRDVQFQNYGDNLVRLRGKDSGKCVDVRNSDATHRGTPSVIFTCDYADTKNDNAGPPSASPTAASISATKPPTCASPPPKPTSARSV
ncbi:RICIN domain-containing protein [Streptomyces sp. CBMA152]|uniref:RICIN domain-containing protein n=1 Tax=Streptomyces sp. CBMA152 TaxID=1896312 RepID=UPI001660241E|nr:RICIN domain-containing protein [Streptomyces sp. CBMA152]MBD0743767.1 hypothetical protein [Streptomyces sp. CBMA152]